MKINPVKNFVKNNISRFERSNPNKFSRSQAFHLYDKNNAYRGEYQYDKLHSSGFLGVKTSMSNTRIMSEDLKLQMQEFVYTDRNYVNIYEPKTDDFLKVKPFPTKITTITVILDHINDKFTTIRSVSKLKNKLQRMTKDNPDYMWSDNYVVYEPLKERPQYEKTAEFVREGSISETNKKSNGYKRNFPLNGSINQVPYRFW